MVQLAFTWQEPGRHNSFRRQAPADRWSKPERHSQWDWNTRVTHVRSYGRPAPAPGLNGSASSYLSRSIVDTLGRLWIAASLFDLTRVDGHADSPVTTVALMAGTQVLVWTRVDTGRMDMTRLSKTWVHGYGPKKKKSILELSLFADWREVSRRTHVNTGLLTSGNQVNTDTQVFLWELLPYSGNPEDSAELCTLEFLGCKAGHKESLSKDQTWQKETCCRSLTLVTSGTSVSRETGALTVTVQSRVTETVETGALW